MCQSKHRSRSFVLVHRNDPTLGRRNAARQVVETSRPHPLCNPAWARLQAPALPRDISHPGVSLHAWFGTNLLPRTIFSNKRAAVLGLKHNPVGVAVMEVIYLAFVAVFAIAATYHISVIHNRLRSTPNLRINHQAAERNIKTARRLKWVMAGISIIVAIAFFVLLSRLPKRIEKRDRVEYVGTIGIREVIPRLFANFAMWLTAVLLVFYFFAHYDSQRDQRSSSAPGPSTTGQIPGTPGTPSALLREYSSTPASKIRAITGHASPSASSKETDVELTPRPELLQMARPVEVPTAQV
eukprot:TRINITY_DN2482_c0_g1_i3.p1 TRINITY_DN2482_c0_g1~~TRINITY_DN2482_c0_g1_i3.p1  ORF type:complete len:297 (-),score=44.72 TRINITY_DN2482_c0_g1_i3:114-1004(-)